MLLVFRREVGKVSGEDHNGTVEFVVVPEAECLKEDLVVFLHPARLPKVSVD